MLDKRWFIKYQKILIWFANSILGRQILKLSGDPIVRIFPQAVFRKGIGKQIKAEFRMNDWFARKLKSTFYPAWYLFHLWDTLFANNFYPKWNLGFDSLTFNPHATGRGDLRNIDTVYANARGETAASEAVSNASVIAANDLNGANYLVGRGFMPFDTSALGGGATVTAGNIEFYGFDSRDTTTDDTFQLVQSTQANNTSLVQGDFDQAGTTGGGTSGAYSTVTTGQYNTLITLNATALTWINTTGYTPLAMRATGDLDNTTPTTRSYLIIAVSVNPIKLNITFTPRRGSMLMMSQ